VTLSYISQQLVNGLALGSLYALLAVGLSMVYGILRLINFAHGELMMLAAMASATVLAGLKLWPPLLLVGAMLIGGLLGLILERVAYSRLRQASEVNLLVTSLAVATFLSTGALMMWGGQPRRFDRVEALSRLYEFQGVFLRGADIAIFGVAIGAMVALTLLTSRTRLGVAMRAVAENLNVSALMGVNPSRPIALAFFLGSLLAGAAGVLWGWKFGQVSPLMGFIPMLKAFVAAVLGGIGSIPGAFLGGIVLGLAEVFFVGMLPVDYSGYRDVFVFSLLFLVLLIRPTGLLGTGEGKRA
jgi:branched-chain amino acid transport system permease protein